MSDPSATNCMGRHGEEQRAIPGCQCAKPNAQEATLQERLRFSADEAPDRVPGRERWAKVVGQLCEAADALDDKAALIRELVAIRDNERLESEREIGRLQERIRDCNGLCAHGEPYA